MSKLLIPALLLTIGLSNCSWNPDLTAEATLRISDSPNPLAREAVVLTRPSSDNPVAPGNMHCFFANVAGAGISPTVSSAGLNFRDPNCFGLGAVSKGALLSELSGKGFTFRIPIGTKRTVRVFGVYKADTGTACSDYTFEQLFSSQTRPRVYVLGETANTDIYRDSVIRISNSYNYQTATDLAESCQPDSSKAKLEPGDPKALPPIKGARLIVATVPSIPDPNLFSFGVTGSGEFQLAQSLVYSGTAKYLQLEGTNTRLVMSFVNATGGRKVVNKQLFAVQTQTSSAGQLTSLSLGTAGSDDTAGYFSLDPIYRFIYTPTAISDNVGTYAGDAFSPLGSASEADLQHTLATNGFVYHFVAPTGLTQFNIKATRRDENTGALTPTGASPAMMTSTGANAPPITDGKNGIFVCADNKIYFYSIADANGSLTQLSFATLPMIGGSNIARGFRLSFDPIHRRLFILARDSVAPSLNPGAIIEYPVDAAGNIGPTPTVLPIVAGANNMVLSPDGNRVFYTVAGVSKISQFYTDDGVSYSAGSEATLPLAPLALAIVPLF